VADESSAAADTDELPAAIKAITAAINVLSFTSPFMTAAL